jgi:hypothetical protein
MVVEQAKTPKDSINERERRMLGSLNGSVLASKYDSFRNIAITLIDPRVAFRPGFERGGVVGVIA